MGGSAEMIARTQNWQNTIDDLDIVYCSVDISLSGNNVLFNRLKIHKLLTAEIVQFLERYGVKHKIEPLSGLGGGGESLLTLIKELWRQEWFFKFLFSILKLFLVQIIIKNRGIFYKVSRNKPRLEIFFRIQTDRKISSLDDSSLNKNLKARLLNLQNISEELFKILSEKHPLFLFDQQIRASVYSRSFRISYFIPYERQGGFNQSRLTRLINSLVITNNTDFSYSFLRGLIISRNERSMTYNHGGLITSSKSRQYYLVLSTKVLKDYLHSFLRNLHEKI